MFHAVNQRDSSKICGDYLGKPDAGGGAQQFEVTHSRWQGARTIRDPCAIHARSMRDPCAIHARSRHAAGDKEFRFDATRIGAAS